MKKKNSLIKQKSEKVILKEILLWLSEHNFLHWRQNSGTMFIGGRRIFLGRAGLPDIIVIHNLGQVCGLEVKSARGKQTPAQKKMQKEFVNNGAPYCIVRNIQDVEDIFGRGY